MKVNICEEQLMDRLSTQYQNLSVKSSLNKPECRQTRHVETGAVSPPARPRAVARTRSMIFEH